MEVAVGLLVLAALVAVAVLVIRRGRPQPVTDLEHPTAARGHPDQLLGAMLAQRLLDPKWIHRRVDSIRFQGDHRMRRHISVDIEVDAAEHRHHDVEFNRRWLVVPLAFIAKRRSARSQNALRDFDLRTDGSTSIPLLGGRDNAHAAWSVLVHVASVTATVPVHELHPDELDLLWTVVAGPFDEAQKAVDAIDACAKDPAPAETLSAVAKAGRDSSFRYLLGRFASDYLLLAEVPDSRCGRQVLKFAYDMEIPWSWWRNSLAVLGLTSCRLNFTASAGVLPCRSLHFEIQLPPRVQATLLECTTARRIARVGDVTHRAVDESVRQHGSIPHVHVGQIEPGTVVSFLARISLRRDATLWLTFTMSLLLTAGLLVGRDHASAVLAASDSTRPVLLLVPGLIVGAVLLRSDDKLVARLMSGQRLVVLVMVIVALLATVSVTFIKARPISVDEQAAIVEGWWFWLALVSGCGTASLIPSMLGGR